MSPRSTDAGGDRPTGVGRSPVLITPACATRTAWPWGEEHPPSQASDVRGGAVPAVKEYP
jgi:hypothetical protein